MLTQPGDLSEGIRGLRIGFTVTVIPGLRLQRVDGVLTGQEVNIGTSKSFAQLGILHFRIQADDPLAGLPEIAQQKLEQITLALTAVAKNQDVGVGLVRSTAVEVHQNVRAELVTADETALGICLTGKVEGEGIRHTGAGKDTLILCSELIRSEGQDGEEAFLLPEQQTVHGQFGAEQFHIDFALEIVESFQSFRLQLDEYRTVEQILRLTGQIHQHLDHILEVAFRFHRFLQVVAAGLHAVAPLGVIDDLGFLCFRNSSQIHTHGHTAAVCQPCEDRLFFRGGRVFPKSPDTSVAVAHDIVIGLELDGSGQDAVEEVLGSDGLGLLRSQRFVFLFSACRCRLRHIEVESQEPLDRRTIQPADFKAAAGNGFFYLVGSLEHLGLFHILAAENEKELPCGGHLHLHPVEELVISFQKIPNSGIGFCFNSALQVGFVGIEALCSISAEELQFRLACKELLQVDDLSFYIGMGQYRDVDGIDQIKKRFALIGQKTVPGETLNAHQILNGVSLAFLDRFLYFHILTSIRSTVAWKSSTGQPSG